MGTFAAKALRCELVHAGLFAFRISSVTNCLQQAAGGVREDALLTLGAMGAQPGHRVPPFTSNSSPYKMGAASRAVLSSKGINNNSFNCLTCIHPVICYY